MKLKNPLLLILIAASLSLPVHSEDPSKEDDFIDLFSAGDFSAWSQLSGSPVAEGWKIENGVIQLHAKGGDIITLEKYKDFELVFEWKISKAGNSGVKYRTHGRLGLEYQVLDDKNHPDNEKPNHRPGSIYDLVAAPEHKQMQAVGEWNQARIIAKGNHIEHWLNGKKVATIEFGSEDWDKRFEQSKYKKHDGFGNWEGPILLQDHHDPVSFRNVRIRRLNQSPSQ